MTRQPNPRPDRTDDLWIVSLVSISGLAAAAFVLFLTFEPNAGKLASDIAQAEYPFVASSAAVAEPAPARLASGR